MLSILFFFLPFFFLSFTGRQSAGYFHFPTEGENSGFLHWSDVLCYFLPLGHSDHGFESHVKYSCTNLSMLHLCCAVLVEAWSVLISNPESYWMSVSGFINPENARSRVLLACTCYLSRRDAARDTQHQAGIESDLEYSDMLDTCWTND